MGINLAIAKGYVMNARNRRHKCEEWSEWLGLMPVGEPITATQLAERISRAHDGSWYFTPSWQSVSAMLNAVKATGVVMRMEVAVEPYEIEVETRCHWSNEQNCYVEGGMKKITIDKKTVFIRMV
jgi:hypothetical protein